MSLELQRSLQIQAISAGDASRRQVSLFELGLGRWRVAGRTRNIEQLTQARAKFHRARGNVTRTVLETDPDTDLRLRASPPLDPSPHQLTDTPSIEHLNRIRLQDRHYQSGQAN